MATKNRAPVLTDEDEPTEATRQFSIIVCENMFNLCNQIGEGERQRGGLHRWRQRWSRTILTVGWMDEFLGKGLPSGMYTDGVRRRGGGEATSVRSFMNSHLWIDGGGSQTEI